MNIKLLKDKIFEVLKADERLWSEDKKEFNHTLLIDLLEKVDEKIIELFLPIEEIREKFFVKIKDVFVFKINDFRFFMEENKIDNSYTAFKNRIGLTDGKRFIKDTQDIVLDFPFKDCVLEGGQSTEEGLDTYFEYDETVNKTQVGQGYKAGTYNQKTAKRKEIFFNQVLAKDEIDRLRDPKALVNWKRFTKDGEQEVREIKRDESGTIKENMIIKGNNLLALHSLKQQFAGKVKLIYIDPPYNTGGDANIFTYNNTFNHSTWLTFIKNRLEVGEQLLRDDGFIAISIDHCELLYLGVLADNIFGQNNRLGIVTVVHKPEGRSQQKFFGTSNEYLLVYAKNKANANFNNIIITERKKETFDKEDNIGKYKLRSFIRGEVLRKQAPDLFYPIYVSPDLQHITLEANEGYEEIYPISGTTERIWFLVPESFKKKNQKNEIVAQRNSSNKVNIFYKVREREVFVTHWADKKYNAIAHGTKLLEKILGRKAFSYPKSVYQIIDILKIMTSDDDIILDFHAGSGTTGHATIALNKEDGGNRIFILVEQLNEHIDICTERNQKVMEKENIDGDFLYFELAKWNETAKEKILDCESLEELLIFFDEMYERYFINYNLKTKEFKEKVLKEPKFLGLSLEEQKKIFIAMLDNNQMYVNKSEMADKKYSIPEQDQVLTAKFYGEEQK